MCYRYYSDDPGADFDRWERDREQWAAELEEAEEPRFWWNEEEEEETEEE